MNAQSGANQRPWSPRKRERTIRRGWRSIVLGSVLVMSLGLPSLAHAAGTTPDLAQVLDVMSPTVSDNLVGSTGGVYAYYRVAYQGGNAPVLFTLTHHPYWGSGNNTFGFNLYGPSDITYAGQVTGTIVGSSAGSFEYYTLRYPGGNTPLSVTMNASPVYAGSGQAIGFNLYRQVPKGTTSRAATFGIQVFNYAEQTTAAYVIYQVGSQ